MALCSAHRSAVFAGHTLFTVGNHRGVSVMGNPHSPAVPDKLLFYCNTLLQSYIFLLTYLLHGAESFFRS